MNNPRRYLYLLALAFFALLMGSDFHAIYPADAKDAINPFLSMAISPFVSIVLAPIPVVLAMAGGLKSIFGIGGMLAGILVFFLNRIEARKGVPFYRREMLIWCLIFGAIQMFVYGDGQLPMSHNVARDTQVGWNNLGSLMYWVFGAFYTIYLGPLAIVAIVIVGFAKDVFDSIVEFTGFAKKT